MTEAVLWFEAGLPEGERKVDWEEWPEVQRNDEATPGGIAPGPIGKSWRFLVRGEGGLRMDVFQGWEFLGERLPEGG